MMDKRPTMTWFDRYEEWLFRACYGVLMLGATLAVVAVPIGLLALVYLLVK